MILDSLNVGDHITGCVSSIEYIGVFIDLGDAEWRGVILRWQISWLPLNHPSDVLTVGQEIKTKVIRILPERQEILLSLKYYQMSLWGTVANQYHVGQAVEVVVSRVTRFGIIACIKEHTFLEGLLLIAESDQKKDLIVGQDLSAWIARFNPANQRIMFLLKID